jgi:hypothetical protein
MKITVILLFQMENEITTIILNSSLLFQTYSPNNIITIRNRIFFSHPHARLKIIIFTIFIYYS